MRSLVAILAVVFLTGCHESGTWKDDARNWKRIFREAKPDHITVVHSWFWRSPHFTYEYEYYLHVQKHADLQRRLLTLNSMIEIVGEKELRDATAWPGRRPDWFAPKPVAQYQVLMYSNAPNSEFRLLIDRETGDLFLTDRLL